MRRARAAIGGLIVAAATLAALVATEPRLAIVWDEGFTIGREDRIKLWFQALRDPAEFARTWRPLGLWRDLVQPDGRQPPRPSELDQRSKLFRSRTLEWFWPFAREEPHGHPPFYALVGLIGDVLAPSWERLARARLAPMILFSLTNGWIFAFLARRLGGWAAAAASLAWLLQPRLFAHAHYAHYDNILTCLWVCAVLAFLNAVESRGDPVSRPRWGWTMVFGLVVGCAWGTKLTGWFLPLPFLAWTALYRDRRAAWVLGGGCAIALVTVYALTPPWWPNPVGGVWRFLWSNLTRAHTTRIPTLFLGRVILTPQDSLPWYNTLVWTVFVTPVLFLAMAMAAAARGLGRWRLDRFGTLALGNWAFLLALRSLPHTPGHDGERQFLAAFGCLALAVGLGAAWAVERLGRWGKALIAAALVEGLVSIALMMPVPLSYFSPLVGGLPGAARLGMEPTYYWDSMTGEALAWLNANTPPGGKVLFPTYPTIWQYLRQAGKLTAPALPPEPGRWVWYVLQNRPGAFNPEDRWLVARARPENVVVERFGIPLLWVFPHAGLEEARARVGGGSGD